MVDHEEEQREEIEALESIYPDSFEVITSNPYSFCICVETRSPEADEESLLSLSLSIKFLFTPNYPDEAPQFEIVSSTGFSDQDYEKIVSFIQSQIEENLGMVMIFTIISSVQDFLNELKDDVEKKAKEERERKEKEAREVEERKCHGTPVTVATFLAWKSKFDMEMDEMERKLRAESKEKKFTGKEIFLQMKNINDDSELLEGETEAVEVDESLFDDLDDLELVDDLE